MSTPADLEERGRSIWVAFEADKLPAGNRALIHEIARSADALDRLDALLVGRRDAWATIVFSDMGDVTLTVDGVLAERRQQQTNLKNLLMEARQAGLKQTNVDAPKDEKESRAGVILQFRDRATGLGTATGR